MKVLTEVEKDEVLSHISREVQKSQTTVLCVTVDDSPDERPCKRMRLSSMDEFDDEPVATKPGLWSRKSRHPTLTPDNFDYPTPTPTFSCISY